MRSDEDRPEGQARELILRPLRDFRLLVYEGATVVCEAVRREKAYKPCACWNWTKVPHIRRRRDRRRSTPLMPVPGHARIRLSWKPTLSMLK